MWWVEERSGEEEERGEGEMVGRKKEWRGGKEEDTLSVLGHLDKERENAKLKISQKHFLKSV